MVAVGIFLGILMAIAVGGFIWFKSGPRTIYFFTSDGFRAMSSGQSPLPRRVSSAEFETAVQSTIDRNPFDALHISASGDDDSNLATVWWRSEGFAIDISFLIQKEQEAIGRVGQAMADLGLEQIEWNHWNEGMGAELEALTISYALPLDAGIVRQAIEAAKRAKGWSDQSEIYLLASDLRDFPNKNWGISFKTETDPLDALFGPR